MNLNYNTERQTLLTLLANYRHNKSAIEKDKYLLTLFQFQYKYNNIYRQYCENIGINSTKIISVSNIPYLPISAFKHHDIRSGTFEHEDLFLSSGTTGSIRSKHSVRSLQLYHENTTWIWSQYFEPVQNYCFYALLPGYLEREGSSLISMVDHFINRSRYPQSGFYLNNHEELYSNLKHSKSMNIPVVLFGVTYALLDIAANFQISFPDLIVMETGGMKGQRQEITKTELHEILKQGLGTERIYSEYGMTELMSQAYTQGSTVFLPNPMMEVHTRQINDPLSVEAKGKSGIICVADLANIDSCAFIQTEDQGISYVDDSFEIIGRLTAADIRGCNLLLEEFKV